MNDVEGVTVKLAELLRHPEDLDKIQALRSEFTRKKAAIDRQLKLGLKEQLEVTQTGMRSITEGQRTVLLIKDEMKKIDELCSESQGMIRDFPNINLVAQTHRNFTQVEAMKDNLDKFNDRLSRVENLLRQDDADLEEMPNLLEIHYELTQLRDIRDDAMEQIRRANDSSLQNTLEDYFTRMDDTVEWFDDHMGTICLNLINIIQSGNNGLVVRLAVIIEEEEKKDNQVKALEEAQRDYKELAARFKAVTAGRKDQRGYKEKFLACIKAHAEQQFMEVEQQFLEDPDRLEKSLRWFFNELNTVKLGMVNLMPKKWKILKTYGDIYHMLMHDFLIRQIDNPDLKPTNMLAIIHWVEKYYAKMEKLGFKRTDLKPQVIDDREAELVREWRQLIIKFLTEWIDRISAADQKDFTERNPDTLERDENGCFRTRNLVDMWRMFREQTIAAGNSDLTDVTEGVIDEMFRVLKARQATWQKLVDDECAKHSGPAGAQEGYDTIYDWLVAVANDQIASVDDNEEGYLSRFKRDFEPLVTPKYMIQASAELSAVSIGYIDLGTHCITQFISLMFAVDFRSTITEFFTPKWYQQFDMKRIVTTFEDYISDYTEVLHPSMIDILIEELGDALLVKYLLCVRNRGAKFRRADPFGEKVRDDVLTAFGFFERFPEDFVTIKEKWRVIDWFTRLLSSEKAAVPEVYMGFKTGYWDLQLSWVEAVLRSRDDFDRAMLNAVKARAAEVEVISPPPRPTIMSKVR